MDTAIFTRQYVFGSHCTKQVAVFTCYGIYVIVNVGACMRVCVCLSVHSCACSRMCACYVGICMSAWWMSCASLPSFMMSSINRGVHELIIYVQVLVEKVVHSVDSPLNISVKEQMSMF